MALVIAGCSCSAWNTNDADSTDDGSDVSDQSDTSDDTGVVDDPGQDPQEEDTAETDPVPDCFPEFGEGYDLAGLGLEVIPRGRPPMDCGDCCWQISFSEDRMTLPLTLDVWGRYLAYSTIGSYCGTECADRVVLVDLQEGIEYLVEERKREPSDPTIRLDAVADPAIFESSLFYSHVQIMNDAEDGYFLCEIVKFSLETGIREVITSFELCHDADHCWCPKLLDAHGDYLAWEDNRDSYIYRVRTFDLVSRTEVMSTDDVATEPQIWNGVIAYDYLQTVVSKTGVYDIPASSTRIFSDGEHDRWYVRIYEDTITWSDGREGGTRSSQTYADIYMMDLGTELETPVCTHPASQFRSLVFGDIIVWSDLRDDPFYPNNYAMAENHNIYGYRISTGEEFRITDLPGREYAMEMFEDRVFFLMDDGTGIDKIFMKVIAPPSG